MNTPIQPYKGLRPYEESDQGNFFGREAECKILLDKFLASRLTLLFAASGVGKSSLLQAAVLPRLKDSRQENRDAVYYKDWVSEPLAGVQQHIRDDLEQAGTISHDMWPHQAEKMSLREFLAFATLFVRQPLVLVLDQFEEFFQYHRYAASFQPFIAELTAAITDRDLPLSVVIAMREDFALELNAFKPALPTLLFENFYRLEPLSRDNATKAIVEPVQQLGFDYEPQLLDALLEDLASRAERSLASSPFAIAPDTVEPAYLQIVCAQLWEADKTNPENNLLYKTYDDKGRADGILKNYIENIVKDFSKAEKSLASARAIASSNSLNS